MSRSMVNGAVLGRSVTPELIVLVPLMPVWLATLVFQRSGWTPVAVVGAVALMSALVIARWLWRRTLNRPDHATHQWVALHILALVSSAFLWVWLQYALNPFRMRGIFDALAISRSAPWQLVAGLYLFASVIVAAWFIRGREVSDPEAKVPVRPPRPFDPLPIRVRDRTVLVNVCTIERLQGCDDHVAVVSGGRRLLASYRLAELEANLDARHFVRIHRSHIVNLAHVAAVDRLDANRDVVVMKRGDRITASRKGTVALRRRIHTTSRSEARGQETHPDL